MGKDERRRPLHRQTAFFDFFTGGFEFNRTFIPFPNHATQQNPEMLKTLVSVPVQIAELGKESMIKQGLITAEEYAEAMKEVQTLLAHPGAFAMDLYFLAVGKVP